MKKGCMDGTLLLCPWLPRNPSETSMHSSRMRTDRGSSHLVGAVPGQSPLYTTHPSIRHSPVDRQIPVKTLPSPLRGGQKEFYYTSKYHRNKWVTKSAYLSPFSAPMLRSDVLLINRHLQFCYEPNQAVISNSESAEITWYLVRSSFHWFVFCQMLADSLRNWLDWWVINSM